RKCKRLGGGARRARRGSVAGVSREVRCVAGHRAQRGNHGSAAGRNLSATRSKPSPRQPLRGDELYLARASNPTSPPQLSDLSLWPATPRREYPATNVTAVASPLRRSLPTVTAPPALQSPQPDQPASERTASPAGRCATGTRTSFRATYTFLSRASRASASLRVSSSPCRGRGIRSLPPSASRRAARSA